MSAVAPPPNAAGGDAMPVGGDATPAGGDAVPAGGDVVLVGRLPPLRADLHCHPAAADRDGAPAFVLEDRVSNRFFRIGWLDRAMLAQWHRVDPRRLQDAVEAETGLRPTAAELATLLRFLRDQHLLAATDPDPCDRMIAADRRDRFAPLTWLLHHYLFFRIPLLRPGRWLRLLAPRLGWLRHPAFRLFAIACLLLGLVLAIPQWDMIRHTAVDLVSPAGLLAFAGALLLAKTVHELGHALTATRLGVRVGHMGVAFLVLWPMLYTDTGESWRLRDRRQRFEIAAAGIRAELMLAGFATLAWSLVPDGPWRQALFALATTTWVLTLLINASPFMRFDGYFLLSDALDMPNLHERSFALARAGLRRTLLGWNEPDPEPFTPALRRFLVLFAWLTWLYRLVLFLGIALAVYLFFFKALGLLLMAVELVWFVARPVAGELALWVRGRRRAEAGQVRRSLLLLLALLAVVAIPWRTTIEAQGWLHAARSQTLHAPQAGRIVALHGEGGAPAGAELLRLEAPETDHRARLAGVQAMALEQQIARSVGRDDGPSRRTRLLEDLAERRQAEAAEHAEQARLTVRAPFAGRIVDRDPTLRPGVWVAPRQALLTLVDPVDWVVEALVEQQQIGRVRVGAVARFRAWRGTGPDLPGHVEAIDIGRAARLPHPLFAADHGGELATRIRPDGNADGNADGSGLPAPEGVFYRVRIRVAAPAALREASGQVIIEGERRSLLAGWFGQALRIGVRESGF